MIIRITEKTKEKNLALLLKELPQGKKFDASKFCGKIKWEENPVEYQRKIRDEWE
ncbi:MAG: hypothetical protein SFU91_13310 [Chloroherpetonaceae bacterium]|nr:hypothetical protein [Chloroherpetonaceae bacterium]